jgi:hypothetical protein
MARIITHALAAAVVAANVSQTASAFGFNADGFQTGMTVNEVAALAQQRGLTMQSSNPFKAANESYSIDKEASGGGPDPNGPSIVVRFCEDRLVSYFNIIDLDSDYLPLLKTLLEQHGNPDRVRVTTKPWLGLGDGYMSESEMHWHFGADRVVLSFNPEGRTTKGVLRYTSGSWVTYETQTQQCPFLDW